LLAICLIVTLADAAPGVPDPALELSGVALVRALQAGGYVIYFRHADTGSTYPEPAPVDLQRCETQRNLNEDGQIQARQIGEQFRRLRIPVGEVLASEFCRCWQTAELAFGRFRKVNALTGVSRDPASAEQRVQSATALRRLLAIPPSGSTNTILVSHGYNLSDAEGFLLGTQGEAAIYLPDGHGNYRLRARLAPEDWARLPRAAE
jgi:broad specificity phosphatase PhoE